jgi:RNA polymerase sigma-70 factor (ECF subfamily)
MSGGSEDWTEWLDQHGATLLLFARQWITNRNDAEDVVQEAFVRFWRRRSDVSEPLGYLYASVKHCALDRLRQRKRQTCREEFVARAENESLFSHPSEQAELVNEIEDALRHLPELQREVLVLKTWGGLTFPQIAAALQISASTAASRYRYALDKLRETLMKESIR